MKSFIIYIYIAKFSCENGSTTENLTPKRFYVQKSHAQTAIRPNGHVQMS